MLLKYVFLTLFTNCLSLFTLLPNLFAVMLNGGNKSFYMYAIVSIFVILVSNDLGAIYFIFKNVRDAWWYLRFLKINELVSEKGYKSV